MYISILLCLAVLCIQRPSDGQSLVEEVLPNSHSFRS